MNAFPIINLWQMTPTGQGLNGSQGHGLQDLQRSTILYDTQNIKALGQIVSELIFVSGFPHYQEFRKGPEISTTVFPVMKSPELCNFHHFSMNLPGKWFALETQAPERI